MSVRARSTGLMTAGRRRSRRDGTLRRMFLTFLARMLPALNVAKPACIRKMSAPANEGTHVLSWHVRQWLTSDQANEPAHIR